LLARGSDLPGPLQTDGARGIQAFCFPHGLKVILDRTKHTVEVYDLKSDPGELKNLLETGDERVQSAVQTARLFFQTIELKDRVTPRRA
jgi:hypothetical protein